MAKELENPLPSTDEVAIMKAMYASIFRRFRSHDVRACWMSRFNFTWVCTGVQPNDINTLDVCYFLARAVQEERFGKWRTREAFQTYYREAERWLDDNVEDVNRAAHGIRPNGLENDDD